jgi:hypothetical protein
MTLYDITLGPGGLWRARFTGAGTIADSLQANMFPDYPESWPSGQLIVVDGAYVSITNNATVGNRRPRMELRDPGFSLRDWSAAAAAVASLTVLWSFGVASPAGTGGAANRENWPDRFEMEQDWVLNLSIVNGLAGDTVNEFNLFGHFRQGP